MATPIMQALTALAMMLQKRTPEVPAWQTPALTAPPDRTPIDFSIPMEAYRGYHHPEVGGMEPPFPRDPRMFIPWMPPHAFIGPQFHPPTGPAPIPNAALNRQRSARSAI